ncbi:MAG TPA: hypothetical protein VFO55_12590 [Gemmatimonadaceae bacterium]|nr:hypothetical protein [Gemmatimonadaceae bacterium]
MAARRRFAALIDQDSVVVLEYLQEKAGFRLVDTRVRNRRFATPDAAADAVIDLLADMKAKQACLAIVLQHFGSFFHTLVMPPADDEVLRPAILREVQRSFNIADPAIAFSAGPSVERRDNTRAGGQVPRQMFIAGAPNSVIETLEERFSKARVKVEGLTIIPEVFRRLYSTLDGSSEATAVLICLHNGPHVAFFVSGQLELVIEPPLALEGEAPLDSAVIVDQLERGAIFLRQQARGTVATRLLLAAPAADYEALASTIEARTGMHVAPLGQGIGAPESVVAMGGVLAAQATDSLDLYPRAPAFEKRLKDAMSGPGLVATTLLTAAAVAAFWAGLEVLSLRKTRVEVERLQAQVERALPTVSGLRQTAQGRERIAGLRAALQASTDDRAAISGILSSVAGATSYGARLDSISILRVEEGLQTRLSGQASGTSGPAATSAATGFYGHFRRRSDLAKLDFQSVFIPRGPADKSALARDDLRFTISFVASAGSQ